MIKLKIILTETLNSQLADESVKFSKFGDILKGMQEKYGSDLLSGTFGVELEYLGEGGNTLREPENREYEDLESFTSANYHSLKTNFFNWVDDEGDKLNNDYIEGKADKWDNTYGPIDIRTWLSRNPRPEGAWGAEAWEAASIKIKNEYKTWEQNVLQGDVFEKFCQKAWEDGTGPYEYEYEVDYDDYGNEDETDQSNTIDETIRFISRLGERCINGNHANASTWAVGMDGDNVELRTRHLRLEDLPKLSKVMDFLTNMETTGNMSAHVHVGLPETFNAFDLLAMWNLVDEQQVTQDIGIGRNLESWSKLQNYLGGILVQNILSIAPESGADNIFPMKRLEQILRRSEKFTGTNLSAFFEHHTIEFRYFSSNIKNNANLFFKWIQYFLLLPKIASTRSQVILKNDYYMPGSVEKIVITRRGADAIQIDKVTTGTKIPKPKLPMSQVSTSNEDPNTSLKQKLAKKFGKPIKNQFGSPIPTAIHPLVMDEINSMMRRYGFIIERIPAHDTQQRTVYVNNERNKFLYVYPDRHVRYVYSYPGNGGLNNWTHHDFGTWNAFVDFVYLNSNTEGIPPIRSTT
jgi:hypothetical protein